MAVHTTPALLAQVASRYGSDPGVLDGDTRLTWSQLAERARELARAVIAHGIEPGDRVAIWAPNCWEWVVAVLGLHSAGAVLVPINTRYRGEEAADLLERSRARLLFTVGEFLGTDYLAMLGERRPAVTETVVVLRSDAPPAEGHDAVGLEAFLEHAGRTPAEEVDRFYSGYGPVEIDSVALAYFRYERILEDIALYCDNIWSNDDDGEDLRQALIYLTGNYAEDGTIATAIAAEERQQETPPILDSAPSEPVGDLARTPAAPMSDATTAAGPPPRPALVARTEDRAGAAPASAGSALPTTDLVARMVDAELQCMADWMDAMADLPGNPLGIAIRSFGNATALLCRTIPAQLYNRVFGLTVEDRDQIRGIVDFYQVHGASPVFDLSPYSIPPYWVEPNVFPALVRHGFYHGAFQHLLYGTPTTDCPEPPPGITIRVVEPDDADAFAYAYDQVWGGSEAVRVLIGRPRFTCYLAFVGGTPAALGILHVANGVGSMANGLTVPGMRKRGCQTALLHRRIADAARAGCDLLVSQCLPGSASQKNHLRAGFQIAGSKAWWVRNPPEEGSNQ